MYLLKVRNWQQLRQTKEELRKKYLQIAVILRSVCDREDILWKTRRE